MRRGPLHSHVCGMVCGFQYTIQYTYVGKLKFQLRHTPILYIHRVISVYGGVDAHAVRNTVHAVGYWQYAESLYGIGNTVLGGVECAVQTTVFFLLQYPILYLARVPSWLVRRPAWPVAVPVGTPDPRPRSSLRFEDRQRHRQRHTHIVSTVCGREPADSYSLPIQYGENNM